MKKILTLSLFILITIGCSKSENGYFNPYLPNVPVNFTADLMFNDNLKYANGHAIFPNQGIGGVLIINANGGYLAYDIACPNHPYIPKCSDMKVTNTLYLTCTCSQYHAENYDYFLLTNQINMPNAQYRLKEYPAERRGNIIYVRY